jgi:CheY-like chemotaxis protein
MRAGLRVLVVEDNPGDVHLVARAFEETESRARLYGARDASEAFAMLEVAPLDLMLLDLWLPGLGGLDILAHVRGCAAHRDLPVVVMTSSPTEADRDASLSLGADGFITKPSTYEDLLQLVKDLLAQYRSRR